MTTLAEHPGATAFVVIAAIYTLFMVALLKMAKDQDKDDDGTGPSLS